MESFRSINTPVEQNPYYASMAKNPNTICSHCYARNMEKRFPALREKLIPNSKILSSPLSTDQIKALAITDKAFRFHSTGELINEQHLLNFYAIAIAYPSTIFSLWTKRADIIRSIEKQNIAKPPNMILIYSSPLVGHIYNQKDLPAAFDKIFTVHNNAPAAMINCKKSCKDCMLCYTKNNTVYIHESLRYS